MSSESLPNSNSLPAPDPRPKKEQIIEALTGKKPASSDAGQAEDARSSKPQPSGKPLDGSASKPEGRPEEHPLRPALELDDDDDAGGGKEPTAAERKFLKEFAKEAGISVKRAFNLMVEDGDNAVSIGELADHWRENRQFSKERDDFEYQRAMAQNEILATRRQIEDMAGRIRSVIGDDAFERVAGDIASEQREQIRQAKAQLLEFFPSWANPEVMREARGKIEQLLGSYGVSKYEVGGISDPRAIKFIEDARLLKEKYERLRNGQAEKRPTTTPPSTKRHQPSRDQQAQALADKGDKIGAISILLGG